ncbi:MAG TPA: VOC family protein [Gemmatimonadota bacterium]|nr:VOC family protein [Gemmatimonadota bacterium]
MTSNETELARGVGINHVALEVDDIEEALAFYGRLFEIRLRGRSRQMAFIDLGDQFVALSEGREQARDTQRHFGLVVDDREKVRRAARAAGATMLPGRGLDFLDPWGNHVQVVQYDEIQFTKADHVLRGMGLRLGKSGAAIAELAEKGMAPERAGQAPE